MEVLGLTIFISFALGVLFAAMFFFSRRDSRRGLEQEALLPLSDNAPASAPASPPHPVTTTPELSPVVTPP